MYDEPKPLIAKNDEPRAPTTPSTGEWDAAVQAVEELEDYDFDARRRQQGYDLKHARDHLP